MRQHKSNQNDLINDHKSLAADSLSFVNGTKFNNEDQKNTPFATYQETYKSNLSSKEIIQVIKSIINFIFFFI